MTDQPTPPEVPETQAVYPPPRPPMTAEERAADMKARRNRNIVMGLGLLAFIVIVYLVTVLKMGGAVVDRPL